MQFSCPPICLPNFQLRYGQTEISSPFFSSLVFSLFHQPCIQSLIGKAAAGFRTFAGSSIDPAPRQKIFWIPLCHRLENLHFLQQNDNQPSVWLPKRKLISMVCWSVWTHLLSFLLFLFLSYLTSPFLEILEIDRGATPDQIKKAYRKVPQHRFRIPFASF